MTQPKFSPISIEDELRPASKLETPRPWVSHRPGEFRHGKNDARKGFGVQGPDQGYALHLARMFGDKIQLELDEERESVMAGAVAIALARAARFGRAPVATDIEFALTLFGFLSRAPSDLIAFRKSLFQGVDHDYWRRDALVARVPTATLGVTPTSLREKLVNWQSLISNEVTESDAITG